MEALRELHRGHCPPLLETCLTAPFLQNVQSKNSSEAGGSVALLTTSWVRCPAGTHSYNVPAPAAAAGNHEDGSDGEDDDDDTTAA